MIGTWYGARLWHILIPQSLVLLQKTSTEKKLDLASSEPEKVMSQVSQPAKSEPTEKKKQAEDD